MAKTRYCEWDRMFYDGIYQFIFEDDNKNVIETCVDVSSKYMDIKHFVNAIEKLKKNGMHIVREMKEDIDASGQLVENLEDKRR